MKPIFQLFVVSLFLLSGCAASIPSPTLEGQVVYSNENDIFVMNMADSQVTRVTNDPEWDFDAAWSHDGSQIVFRSPEMGMKKSM